MIKGDKNPKLRTWILAIASVAGPVVFEIMDTISGEWLKENGQINWTGKSITIICGIVYLGIVVCMTVAELREKKTIKSYTDEIKALRDEDDMMKFTLTNIDNAIGYANENVRKQAEYLQKQNDSRIRELDIVNFATNACAICYEIFSRLWGKDYITVNIYQKFKEKDDKKIYTKMIAHEGHITQPKYFGHRRILKRGKDNYFCERIMLDENPSYVILLSPEDVARQFNIPVSKCKYKQYIAIPIFDASSKLRLLVEINVINKPVITNEESKVQEKIAQYFMCLKDYLLLMLSIENYASIVDDRNEGGGVSVNERS